jgi:hypothetical protein
MNFNKKRGFRYIFFVMAFVFSMPQQASAGLISVVADVNANGSDNFSFYDAILGSSQDVIFSRSEVQQTSIFNHYNTISGVTATVNSSTLTSSLLNTIDLLVVTSFFNNPFDYTTNEMFSIASFVADGGSVLMISEASDTTNFNTFLSGIGSSISYTSDRHAVLQNGISAESTSLGLLSPFSVNAYNTLSGGTAVYNAASGTVVAFEFIKESTQSTSVSEPSTLAILALGVLGLASCRFKKES